MLWLKSGIAMNMACMTILDEYVYRAAARTGKDGKYHFRTIMPVPYSVSNTATRPAHSYAYIRHRGQDLVNTDIL